MNEAQALRWRAWLELEQEAVWFYPIVAARFDDLAAAATSDLDAHRDLRDDLVAVFADADSEPPGQQLAYEVGDMSTADAARAVAADLERRLCAAIAALSGAVEGEDRERAVAELRAAAVRAVRWGSEPEPFPGLD